MLPLVPVLAICFVATLTRSTFGFGESLVAVPLLALVIPIDVAVPLAVAISIVVAAIVLVQDHGHVDFHSARWLVAWALLGIPLGLAVLVYADAFAVKIALGSLVVAYSAASLVRPHAGRSDSRAWLVACGFVSGVLGGAYGLNGPPLVVYGNLRGWDARQFRATLQAYFLPASLVGAAGLAANGLYDREVLHDFLACLPVVVPAVLLGRSLNRRLAGAAFFRYVYAGLIVAGAALLIVTIG